MTSLDPIQAALDFQKGSEKAFEYFFKELYPQLTYYAMRILKKASGSENKEDAENVVSDAFMKIWQHRKDMHHPLQIRSWLYTTVRNDCLNLLHSHKVKVDVTEELGVDDSFRERIKSDTYGILWAVVSALPDKCRDIIILYYVAGLNSREIAEAMNLSVSTVKNQLKRGIKLIRKKYGITDKEANDRNEYLLRKVYNSTMSISNISRLFGLSINTVSNVRSGKAFKTITNKFNNTP
jgi:RNA polymerase sigma-70 factor (family 1)